MMTRKKSFMKREASGGHAQKHSLGQNFINDEDLLEELAQLSLVTPEDCVLEIGPGMGTLTRHLSAHCAKLAAVEIDTDLRPFLEVALEGHPNAEVVFADVMKTDLRALCREHFGEGASVRVAANLPYYITTDILEKLMRELPEAKSVAVMVQKEVAEKLTAGPREDGYGPLSLICRWYYEPEIARIVPAECFDPKPKVDSAFLLFRRRAEHPFAVDSEQMLLRLIRGAFVMKRKTLVNNLCRMFPLDREHAEGCVLAAGLGATVRAEEMELADYSRLADVLCRETEK